MASNYREIRAENERRYGTDIGRIGPMLLADRYDDRTHFIFELLQNAEDALARRTGWRGSRSVNFHLTTNTLRVSHFGQPFNEADVRGICGIAESTKDLTAIGRFGIGFKSVYAYTERPEIHSGAEDFAIESFVWPVEAPTLDRNLDETVITIPLKSSDKAGREEIAVGLGRLGATALLFLRQIEEIHWSVEGARSGLYLRQSTEIDTGVRRVSVIGQERGETEIDEEWLVFARPVTIDGDRPAGHIEIAFSLTQDAESERERIQRVDYSALVVFFPTVLETHLGFLLQGPYRTTPSRDNVPRGDHWNQRLVSETARLLREALRWLRDHDLLDTTTLRCLPIDPMKFGEASMFAPLFEETSKALSSEALLPRFDSGYVPAARARLARTQELRELFAPAQLAALFGEEHELPWLSGDITQDRTPELRRYVIQQLGVAEVTPETIVPRLDKPFLQAQPDAWIVGLYHFLNGQPALRWRLADLPLVRLEDGSHVEPRVNGQPQAFLPGTIATGFPTVRASVCASDTAREFLRSLGLTEPDPVDDVNRNVLPKYRGNKIHVSDANYEADIRRILTAFATDSKAQRDKLITALRETAFVMVVDTGDGSKHVSKPSEAYLATERLKELFANVSGILLVNDVYSCLRGEDVRELLEVCGATRHLQAIPVQTELSWKQCKEIRREAGLERLSWQKPIVDATLRGLKELLDLLSRTDVKTRRQKAGLLWEALADLESRRGSRAFLGEYTWGYSHESKIATFDAAFVRQLNTTAWVPDANGELQRPEFVVLDTLGWKPNPFLQAKIRFRPPIIEALAKEVGIEPGVFDLLKRLGVTSKAQLLSRLGIDDQPEPGSTGEHKDVNEVIEELLGGAPEPTPPVPDPLGAAPSGPGRGGHGDGGTGLGTGTRDTRGTGTTGRDRTGGHPSGPRESGGKRTPGGVGGRPFISYVGAHPDEEELDPDGLDQKTRMALEEKALALIISREPKLQRTPAYNKGFDLFEVGVDGKPTRWVEVKAMTGDLRTRPVGLSRAQFECAREHENAYWLYVVEHTGSPDSARIVHIQDPAGKARTYTFDHGWLDVAEFNNRTDSEIE